MSNKIFFKTTTYKFNNESIQSEKLISDAFAKHFFSIYIPGSNFNF